MKAELSLKVARILANQVVQLLKPACIRLEIAGSIRRQKPADIGDIEIVAISKIQLGLFQSIKDINQPILHTYLDSLLGLSIVKLDEWGPKYRKFTLLEHQDVPVDLFIVTPEQWGYTLAIRTGPASLSKKLVTYRTKRGYLPGHLTVKNSQLWTENGPVPTPEEEHFFQALELPWLDPERRSVAEYDAIMEKIRRGK
jgi:DNA polymerase/3'-5' exonuclease PolX